MQNIVFFLMQPLRVRKMYKIACKILCTFSWAASEAIVGRLNKYKSIEHEFFQASDYHLTR